MREKWSWGFRIAGGLLFFRGRCSLCRGGRCGCNAPTRSNIQSGKCVCRRLMRTGPLCFHRNTARGCRSCTPCPSGPQKWGLRSLRLTIPAGGGAGTTEPVGSVRGERFPAWLIRWLSRCRWGSRHSGMIFPSAFWTYLEIWGSLHLRGARGVPWPWLSKLRKRWPRWWRRGRRFRWSCRSRPGNRRRSLPSAEGRELRWGTWILRLKCVRFILYVPLRG